METNKKEIDLADFCNQKTTSPYVEKLKTKAETKSALKTKVQVQFLNGETCIRYKNVPCILYSFNPPEDYHKDAQNQNFALWFKLEENEYKNVSRQLKPHLREMTFWFDKEEEIKLKDFLNDTNGKKDE